VRELFAEAHSPDCRIELRDTDHAVGSRKDVCWSVDGIEQPRLDLARVLTASLHRFKLAALASDTDRLHLHAGLVQHHDRRVLIAGASGAGKTTLTATLASLGFAYGTDEVVSVDEPGDVEPLRKPLGCKPGALHAVESVRQLRHPAFAEWPLDQAHLGLPTRWMAEGPGPASLVVLPERHSDAREVAVNPVPPAAAVRELAAHTFDIEAFGVPRGLRALASVAASTRVVQVRYREANDAVPVIEALLDEPVQPPVTAAPVVGPLGVSDLGEATQTHRLPGSCGVLLGDAGIVWATDPLRLVELSPAAFLAWSSADGTRDPASRAAQLGAPRVELDRLDRELRDSGLLVG
jgi:energy-coupling factor transporter ATP-binding protein EcfA2